MTDQQQRAFCWVAVGCKSDLRGDGVVRRKQVREMLNKLVTRKGMVDDGGLQTDGNGMGNEPPADPQEVLSREGIHEQDDIHLKGQSNSVDSPKGDGEIAEDIDDKLLPETGPRPGEMASRSELGLGRAPDAPTQDKTDDKDDTVKDETVHLEQPPAFAAKAQPITPKKTPTESRLQDVHPFPASATSNESSPTTSTSAPRTPPAKASPSSRHLGHDLHANTKLSSSTRSTSRPSSSAGDGSGSSFDRRRHESTVSVASSSHLSVYHTPRNSHYAPSSATGLSSYSPTKDKRKTRIGMGSNSRATSQSSIKTAGRHDDDGDDEEEEDAETLGDDTAPTPRLDQFDDLTAPSEQQTIRRSRRRAPSEASAQSILNSKQGLLDDDEDVTKQKSKKEVNNKGGKQPVLQPLAPPPEPIQGFSLFYTSALDGSNVDALFEHVVSRCSLKWDHDDYQRSGFFQSQDVLDPTTSRRSLGGTSRKLKNRRSIWKSLAWRRRNSGMEEELGEEERMEEEMRRMVRLSDGKGDEAQRGLGGCC